MLERQEASEAAPDGSESANATAHDAAPGNFRVKQPSLAERATIMIST